MQRRRIAVCLPQRVKRRSASHHFYQVEIATHLIALVREVLRQGLDKCLTTIGKTEPLTIERYDVIALTIQTTQTDIIHHTKITQQTVQNLSLVGTANEVHACLKLHALTMEALQTASHLSPLFENGHIVAVATEYQSTRQAPKPTTDDDNFLSSHLFTLYYTYVRNDDTAPNTLLFPIFHTSPDNGLDTCGASDECAPATDWRIGHHPRRCAHLPPHQ